MTPTPIPLGINLAYTVSALTDIGVFPVIALGAVLFVATIVYKRFRK
jgi:hypothetical protein